MKSYKNLLLIAVISLFIVSCTKTGDVGPAGATGPAGPAGPGGPTGPTGPVGNANVKVDTFTLASTQWIYNSSYFAGISQGVSSGYFTKYYDYALPRATAAFLQSGLILVYFSSEPSINANTFSPLPFSFIVGTGYSINLAYENYVGKLRLHFFLVKVFNDAPALNTYAVPKYKFKVITVEGNLTGRKGTPPDIHDYKATCKYYGIAE